MRFDATCMIAALAITVTSDVCAQTFTKNTAVQTTASDKLSKAERLARRSAEVKDLIRAKGEARTHGQTAPMTTLTVVTGKGQMELPMDEMSAIRVHKLLDQDILQPKDLMPTADEEVPSKAALANMSATEITRDRLEREAKHRKRILRLIEEKQGSN